MQQGSAPPPYFQYPNFQNPNSSDPPYASAPPFTASYSTSDYSLYPSSYPAPPPSYSHIPDPVAAPPPPPSYPPSSSPNLPPFNSPPQPSSFPPFDSHLPYQPPNQQQQQPQPQQQPPYYPPFDQLQTPPNYAPPSNPTPNPSPLLNPNSTYSAVYSAPYSQANAPTPPVYDNPYENSVKYDAAAPYFDDGYGGFNRSRSDFGSDLYGKRSESGLSHYDSDGVYAYEGPKVEPYGARGTAPKSSAFDDYGRSIGFGSAKDSSANTKIVRAVPKAETQQDVKGGVQKFRVKLLPETLGQSTMDVLCQIGLDGIRMLDPSTSRTLRIYPLETISRCEVTDSSTLAFWSKSSVDIEPRRIRLQSNSYTTNTLLDTVTAATVQIKEMGGRSRPVDSLKINEQPTDKKKGFGDWMNIIKPGNEEKDHWVPDEAVSKCTSCGTDFGAFVRRHHCRNCGDIFCDKCTHGRIALTVDENAQPVRVCDRCMAEVTQRLSNAKEAASKPVAVQSHEDLAKKLQEEMERNRRASSGSKSDGSGRRLKEVACPICTVHLQVQVPSSGSETIECGVCQHPFLVSAH
ncbi:hypothetical protein F2P56_026355 [Juglans regia]|uniref:Protein FREE1 n=2 Tax=Juglans regia TaxID=51240 RepID=A0A2I4G040_JUGRE|nr:protein FREE1 [Juglans regia]KAF5451235.1 hypothetical protein F2P56_026355 [Juglans regia]